jgi:hypothetical protein
MKNLNKINEVSSYKKIGKQYVDFSIVLNWYKNNKNKIADILKVPVENLASEEDLVSQSTDLINQVINRQTRGNTRVNDQVSGFEQFKVLEENLIHDILHNIYQADSKEFDKSLESLQFSESEIIEEIECLAIEESFMKYMKTPYLKSDFINTNINNLFSFLVLTIIQDDIERVFKYLSGEMEPYIEVYGKKYNVMGTPFERVFTSFKMLPSDFSNIKNDSDYRAGTYYGYNGDTYTNINAPKITTPNDFKTFLVDIYKAAEETDNNPGGDSSQFPTGGYDPPLSDWDDLTSEQQLEVIADFFNPGGETENGDVYTFVQISDLNIKPEKDDDNEDEDNEDEDNEDYNYYDNDYETVNWYDKNYKRKRGNFDEDTDYVMVKNGIEFVDLDDDGLMSDIKYHFAYNSFEFDFESYKMGNEKYQALLNMNINELLPILFRSDKFKSYLRRYFRNNDWIVNNTKLETNIRFNDYQSISKNTITENGKRLKQILSEFLQYVKNNFDKVKAEYKENKSINSNFELFRKENPKLISDIFSFVYEIYNVYFNGDIDRFQATNKLQLERDKNINNLKKLRTLPKEDFIFYLKTHPTIFDNLNKSYSNILTQVNLVYSDNILDLINEYYNLVIKIAKLRDIFKRSEYTNELNDFYKNFVKNNFLKKYDTDSYYYNNYSSENKYNNSKINKTIQAFKIDLEYNINKIFLNKFRENITKNNKFFKVELICEISEYNYKNISEKIRNKNNIYDLDLLGLVDYHIKIKNVLPKINPS